MPGRYTHVKPRNERHYPVYKYREMLAAIGSNATIQDVIRSYGYEQPTLGVIQGWRRRNSIPSTWLPILMHWLGKRGLLDTPDQLLKEPF
jgi:hypothetical protein